MADNVMPGILKRLSDIEIKIREIDDRFLDIEQEIRSLSDRLYILESEGADPYD